MSDTLSSDLASLRIDRDAPRRRGGGGPWLVGLIVLLAVVAAGVAAWPRLRARVFKTEIRITEIALVSPAQAAIALTSTGYVVPQVVSKVTARVVGRIARVRVKEGDVVAANDVIAELEDADLKSSIRGAESRVLVARARAQAARAGIAEVRQQLARARQLMDQGFAPRGQVEDLEARVTSLEEQAKAAEAEVRAAEAEVERLRVNLGDLTVTSPLAGTVIGKPAEAGELVGPMAGTIAEIADLSTQMVETDVPEGRLNLVRIGGPTEIVLDAFPDRRYRGQTIEVGKRINRAKATITVKVRFADTLDDVLPDMSARVSFLTEELAPESMREKAKRVVPAAAVTERDGRKVVFVVDEGKARAEAVELGGRVGDGFELLAGPSPGTRVVAEPPGFLADGFRIKEKERE